MRDNKYGDNPGSSQSAKKDHEAIWLVKSADKILGPYRTDEVVESLRAKTIVIIDELITPMTRWRLVRDEPEFYAVVEEIRRGQMTAREDTEVQGSIGTLGAHTLTGGDPQFGELTPTPVGTGARVPLDGSRVTDAEFTDSDSSSYSSHGQSQSHGHGQNHGQNHGQQGARHPHASEVRQYGISYSAADRQSKSSFKSFAWVAAAAAVLVALYMVFNGKFGATKETAGPLQGFERIMTEADAAWVQGEFFTALNLYRQADQLRPRRPEVVSRLAPLLIHLEGATVNAKRALAETLSSLPSGADTAVRSELEIGLGLAALVSDDIPEAEVRYRAARALAPASPQAMFGAAMSAFLSKQYTEAARAFLSISDQPAALLLAARSLAAAEKSIRVQGRRAAEAAIAKALQKTQDFRQEAYLIGAGLDIDSGNRKAAAVKIRAAIDTDPDMTNEHRHDPYLYLEPLSWRELLPTCRHVSDELKSAVASAFLGLCLFKAGDREEASQVVSFALAEAPEEPLLQSVDAYILSASGRFEDARAALRLALKTQSPKLALLVRARVCTRSGDNACAESAWQNLSTQEPPILAAFTSLAELRLHQGDKARAALLIERAKLLSPNYRPTLALKAETEE